MLFGVSLKKALTCYVLFRQKAFGDVESFVLWQTLNYGIRRDEVER